MCSLILLFLLVFGGALGFSSVQVGVPPATVEAIPEVTSPQLLSCKSVPPEQDITEMLSLVGDTFADGEWTQELRSDESRTTATWSAENLGALAFVDYLHYDCGVTREQIDTYFSQDNFAIILGNYQSYEWTAVCEYEGVQLYEYDVVTSRGDDYLMRAWVWQATPTRVAFVQLTFPVTQQAALAEYAGDLFPDLPTCAPAAA